MLPKFSTGRMHMLGQLGITFADPPDEAQIIAYFHHPMLIRDGSEGGRLVQLGGLYHHAFVRTADGWRSRELREELVWKKGL